MNFFENDETDQLKNDLDLVRQRRLSFQPRVASPRATLGRNFLYNTYPVRVSSMCDSTLSG